MDTSGAGQDSTPYWGNDRRRALSRPQGPPSGALIVGGALLLGVFSAVNAVGGLTAQRTGLDTIALQMLLDAGGAALAVVVGLLCVVRWRLVGEAAALWAGLALLTFGSVTMALTGLLPLVYDPAVDTALWLRPASRLVAIALLAVAVASPTVDARLRPGRLMLMTAALIGALAVLFQSTPGLAQHLTGAVDASSGMPASGVGPPLLIAAWTALGVAFVVRGQRESRSLLSWLGLMLAGFGLAELTRVAAAEGPTLWSAGAHLLRLTALAVGVVGATLELQRAYFHQGRDLMDSVVTAATAESRARAERQEVEERAHEARNALAAIEGASQTLERHRDLLDADTRGSLVSALSAEIARLQHLVSAERLQEDRVLFAVAEALAPVITGGRAQGARILVDIDEDLTAFGRRADTAEVVQNLIENARRYAPDSPIVVKAAAEADRVLVRVEDQGPGVAPEQRDAIFHRGVRGRQAAGRAGSGLGLYVSARLMRDQHGGLWLENRPGRGAVFVVALPACPDNQEAQSSGVDQRAGLGLQGSTAALDERDQAREVVDGHTLAADAGRAEQRTVR